MNDRLDQPIAVFPPQPTVTVVTTDRIFVIGNFHSCSRATDSIFGQLLDSLSCRPLDAEYTKNSRFTLLLVKYIIVRLWNELYVYMFINSQSF